MCSLSKLYLSVVLLICGSVAISTARVLSIHGQMSGWFTAAHVGSLQTACGLRYIPQLMIEMPLTQTHLFDAEVSCNAYARLDSIRRLDDYVDDYGVDPYRLWCRFSGSQFELRGGLQKISFGSATVFRPLMWFDQIDVRDPLRITDGVYAALFRYYFLNNANVWLWGLYGNHDIKGWEMYPTDSNTVEYGGRAQVPLFTGEYGMTYHHRAVSMQDFYRGGIAENRLGADGKWDIGAGVWFEAAVVHQDMSVIPEDHFFQYPQLRLEYQRYLNAGLDYTFGIGNGIYALVEHFVSDRADGVLHSAAERRQLSAIMFRYQFGIIDEVTGVVYYDWDSEQLYRYAQWTRTYDRWMITLGSFWNPDVSLNGRGSVASSLAGTGLQFVLAFNH